MIGILTFHWADDYGAMLQAYAFQACLKKLSGEQVEVIPYAPVKLTGRYLLCPFVGAETDRGIRYHFSAYGFVRNLVHFHSYLKRRKNMRQFRCQYLTCEPAVRKAAGLSLEKYSCIFVGSDQVWNPEITIGLDSAYTGDIRKKGDCRLVAYGASFGSDSLPVTYHAEFEKAVNMNFSEISMREKSAVPFVRRFFSGTVTEVLDPALLLGRREWENIAKLPEQEHYILLIYTEYNAQMLKFTQKLSAEPGKRVISVSMPELRKKVRWIDFQIGGGPSEFIGFFQNADYVVTNSFHGTVFSVLMEKQFLAFSHSDKNARLENLLGKLGLKPRLIEYGRTPEREELLQDIDWERVGRLIKKERAASMEFIKMVLEKRCLE